VLAQMSDPQPGWCQQYNAEMLPIWARKFEPPAIAGRESQEVLRTLITIARHTGNPAYLRPIPRGLAYLKTCLLPDGQLARFYELRSNRPLYMTSRYQITYDDTDLPAHYGWKLPAELSGIEAAYQAALAGKPQPPPAAPTAESVGRLLRELDAQGRRISTYAEERLVGQPKFLLGFRYLSSAVFSHNLETLAAFVGPPRR
jgi:hypothetical protein